MKQKLTQLKGLLDRITFGNYRERFRVYVTIDFSDRPFWLHIEEKTSSHSVFGGRGTTIEECIDQAIEQINEPGNLEYWGYELSHAKSN
jgi:hypothetical protein